jgi:hypothetical protein
MWIGREQLCLYSSAIIGFHGIAKEIIPVLCARIRPPCTMVGIAPGILKEMK